MCEEKIKLLKPWTHQLWTIQKMFEKEQSIFNSSDKKNIGLMCNDLGTGKTRTILLKILFGPTIAINYYNILLENVACFPEAICKIVANFLKYKSVKKTKSSELFYKHRYKNSPSSELIDTYEKKIVTEKEKEELGTNTKYPITLLPTSLIVCQHGLFKDPWKNEIENINAALSVLDGKDSLRCHYITRVTDKIDKEVFKRNDVVLCNSNKFSELAKYCDEHRLQWQRVIFDEVNTIDLPNCPSINSLFYWGVLARWNELNKIKNKGFIRSTFSTLTKEQLQGMIVKIDNKDIDPRCFNYKPYIKTNIICKCAPDHRIVNECFPESKLSELMNEELFVDARDYLLGITGGKEESSGSSVLSGPLGLGILELILKKISMNRVLSKISKERRILAITRKIFRDNICLRCNTTFSPPEKLPSFSTHCCHLNYCFDCCQFVKNCPICLEDLTSDLELNTEMDQLSGQKQLTERKLKIIRLVRKHHKLAKDKILPFQYRFLEKSEENFTNEIVEDIDYEDILEKVKKYDEDDDNNNHRRRKKVAKYSNDNNIYDEMKSIMSFNQKSDTREEIRKTEIETKVSECVEEKCDFIMDKTTNKIEATLSILRQHSDKRILIFINNPKMTVELSILFEKERISHQFLNGVSGRMTKLLEKFKAKKIKVLILNGNNNGRGSNIAMTDVEIIYNAKNDQTINQITGRAQRHGRDKNAPPLKVYCLKY